MTQVRVSASRQTRLLADVVTRLAVPVFNDLQTREKRQDLGSRERSCVYGSDCELETSWARALAVQGTYGSTAR